MKGYFSDILNKRVPGVPVSPLSQKPKPTKALGETKIGTPLNVTLCSRCSSTSDTDLKTTPPHFGTLGTPQIFEGVLPEPRHIGASHLVHLRTLEIEDIAYSFNERAAILEYDSHLAREEAELLAFKEGFTQYVTDTYPAIKEEYCMTINPTLRK